LTVKTDFPLERVIKAVKWISRRKEEIKEWTR